MAAIGSIRKHSTLLVIVIGGALAAFILGDFMKRRNRREVNAGKVNGVEITIMDFNKKLDQNIANAKQQQHTKSLSTNETFRLREQTWEQLVRQILMDQQYKDLGIQVGTDEMFNLIQGPNPHPLIKRYFTNPKTGRYDRSLVIQYLQHFNQLPENAQQQWLMLEDYIRADQMQKKYDALIAQGYYIPKAIAQRMYDNQNTRADIEYIAARYSNVPESKIKVTEADYEKYYEEHKNEFKQKKGCAIEYVSFNVLPSAADIAKARKEAILTAEDFKKTDNPLQFAKANSDHIYDTSWLKEGVLPAPIDSVVFHAKPGTVAGPVKIGNTFVMARLLAVAVRPDSMKAEHILIAYKGAFRTDPSVTRTKEEAKKLADSLYRVLKRNPAKFKTLADKFSNDGSVVQNHGDLGWFMDGRMVPAFNEAVVKTKVGHFTVAESQFGFHVIKVTGKKDFNKKVKVAVVAQDIIPSNATYQNVFAKASKIASEAHDQKAFEAVAKKEHLQVHVMPRMYENTYYIPGLENARSIVRWAFKSSTDVGTVSNVFDLEGQYAVAVVTKRYEAGIPSLDEVKDRIKPFVINQVKGKYLAKEMEKYHGNLDKLAAAFKTKKQSMDNLTFNSRNIVGFGMEDKVIGTVFGMKDKTVSQPIVGNAATFVVSLDALRKAGQLHNYKAFISPYLNEFKQRVAQDYPYIAIKDAADIQDNRITFY
ncbi:SurA N-terminal domain-containing protein [Candidatus Sulfidibacterium hydrothermale]|uniref:peptidylprolyl isomerase n=1 Tax=Candidatus Sulfidibacterium hydrothermale TaxID=2875962 RepID=UPI001F0B6DD4|nr:SurA N-terminal domain-containing protein [Candidatus Sulfidibacterium hydrothermale]UBM62858.1 SurA N-terminal domain-containing protein [Candidatus Sulfidibacterium hydrothermale]